MLETLERSEVSTEVSAEVNPEVDGVARPDARPSVSRVLVLLPRLVGGVVAAAVRGSLVAVVRTLAVVEEWLLGAKHATYGFAVARILMGVTVTGTVLSNFTTRLYTFGPGAAWTGQLQYPTNSFAVMFPFSVVNGLADTAVGITVVMVLLAACGVAFSLGWRTRVVMVPLFVLWVGFLSVNPYVQDQSDNLTRMSLMAMFFAGVSERWSLDARRRRIHDERAKANPAPAALTPLDALTRWWRFQPVLPGWVSNVLHNAALVVIAAQICFVYASGGLFKAAGLPWQNGTAVYAPIHTMQFGTWPVLSDLVTAWGPAVGIATIGTVLIQVSFPLLLLHRGTRVFGLVAIMGFHVGIAVLMGLPWFSLAMIALDMVFIRDVTFKGMAAAVTRVWQQPANRATASA